MGGPKIWGGGGKKMWPKRKVEGQSERVGARFTIAERWLRNGDPKKGCTLEQREGRVWPPGRTQGG